MTQNNHTLRPLFLVPFLNTQKNGIDAADLEVFDTLQRIGDVWVILQEHFDARLQHCVSRVYYASQRLGIWGAIRLVFDEVSDALQKQSHSIVVHNGAPRYFDTVAINTVLAHMYNNTGSQPPVEHAVGARADIATSLHSDPDIGHARALLEHFFTHLAIFERFPAHDGVSDKETSAIVDGFSGLQAYSAKRYLCWDFDWTRHTVWGGELEGQLQSVHLGHRIVSVPLPASQKHRTWQATLGTQKNEIIIAMIDQIRKLPALSKPSKTNVEKSLSLLEKAHQRQSWFSGKKARQDVVDMMRFYNEFSTIGPYILL